MRGKRSKQYRKLLKQFELGFGFRLPYQVLVDAELVKDSHRFSMDLRQYLERTLHGEVKILITQCSMRHLYAQNKDPRVAEAIEDAKTFERRRCGHHPDEYPEPLSTMECLSSVVDGAGRGENKHRYVVACQDAAVRSKMRAIPGVPLVYIARSVMILEPMSEATTRVVAKGERSKFRAELKESTAAAGSKRKRGNESDDGESSDDEEGGDEEEELHPEPEKKKKKKRGPKGPNPLSVKKAKKTPANEQQQQQQQQEASKPAKEDVPSDQPAKKKRKRRSKKPGADKGGEGGQQDREISAAADS